MDANGMNAMKPLISYSDYAGKVGPTYTEAT